MIHYVTTNGIGNAWVAAELQIMERQGIPFVLHSLRPPHQNFFGSEWASRLNRATRLLYPLPISGLLLSVLLAPFLFRSRFFAALCNGLFGPRESFRVRLVCLAHLLVACHWARCLRHEQVSLIHAQWIQSSGTVGMYGAWLLGVPFSFTGHAVDLFQGRLALEDKIRRAAFIVCISRFHRNFYLQHGAREDQLHVVHCGIDVEQFAPHRRQNEAARPRILSVGRLIEKKGFADLIDACRLLAQRGTEFECVIAGDGPLERSLKSQIERLGLAHSVQVTGRALLQEELPQFLAGGNVFAQPCVWSKDNDVDGTPRTLMEAMACGLPSVSTLLAGIPDIIEHDRSGLLVEPRDVSALADALERLLHDRQLAGRLSRDGRQHILEHFQIDRCLEPLATLFRQFLPNRAGTLEGRAEAPEPSSSPCRNPNCRSCESTLATCHSCKETP